MIASNSTRPRGMRPEPVDQESRSNRLMRARTAGSARIRLRSTQRKWSGCAWGARSLLVCITAALLLGSHFDVRAQDLSPRPDSAAADEPRFDVDVDGAPARAFFQSLVDGTRTNMLVHPDVTGRVSLTLKHVTIEEVLDASRELYGYDYRRTTRGFLVLPASIQSRVFQLSYLDLQRFGVSKTRVSSGQITQGGNSQYGSNASSGPASDAGGAGGAEGRSSAAS